MPIIILIIEISCYGWNDFLDVLGIGSHHFKKYRDTRYSFLIVSAICVDTEKIYHDIYRSRTQYSIIIPCL